MEVRPKSSNFYSIMIGNISQGLWLLIFPLFLVLFLVLPVSLPSMEISVNCRCRQG
ncbi:hypothetical protein CLOBOL_00541 [Enterocloster bolteae ATCC BAA-613]|uniref:Uncharacterized protein n=1 Tax=Enterocloster bolteae (strain ATCC BAA-613 / DSM 15670 / CCUG 46953 / JCM 12243 / WAL 16351) TaxID=411902 RepID=A8RHY6_ENTBW|nr:hypothetical protein CLOBOL_00541 [Enterocloster bolteae ATCC BAA-613]